MRHAMRFNPHAQQTEHNDVGSFICPGNERRDAMCVMMRGRRMYYTLVY